MPAHADAVLAAVRAAHFAASILLFGQIAFVVALSAGRLPPHFARLTGWSITVFVASALAWLGLEALSMSGLPTREALSAATLGTVIVQTQFGRVWLARMIVCFGLIVALAALRARGRVFAAVLSTLLLVSLAAMGHGGSGRGLPGSIHFVADAAHLLAAGAWLGALVPLVFTLEQARRAGNGEALGFAAQVTRRFSTLGVTSMIVIGVSGILNATYMLSSFAALLDSRYGQLLFAKIALFGVILAIAAINRQRLTPRLLSTAGAGRGGSALHALGRNAVLECLLGFAIVAIVGDLGITIPGHPMAR